MYLRRREKNRRRGNRLRPTGAALLSRRDFRRAGPAYGSGGSLYRRPWKALVMRTIWPMPCSCAAPYRDTGRIPPRIRRIAAAGGGRCTSPILPPVDLPSFPPPETASRTDLGLFGFFRLPPVFSRRHPGQPSEGLGEIGLRGEAGKARHLGNGIIGGFQQAPALLDPTGDQVVDR